MYQVTPTSTISRPVRFPGVRYHIAVPPVTMTTPARVIGSHTATGYGRYGQEATMTTRQSRIADEPISNGRRSVRNAPTRWRDAGGATTSTVTDPISVESSGLIRRGE